MNIAGSNVLIVNADDFGQSAGVNCGVIRAHEHGIVTSASLMVRWPAAEEAASYARTHPALSVGLHLDFGEWACRDGDWSPLYRVVDTCDAAAVREEVERQLSEFRRLLGREPTHIDSHQHAHLQEPVRTIVVAAASGLGIPVRRCSAAQYCGDFYGQGEGGWPYPEGITVASLLTILERLPGGMTELCCHPGEGDDLDSMYRLERSTEAEALCDPRVAQAIDASAIQLVGFARYRELAGN